MSLFVLTLSLSAGRAAEQPLAEKYLLEGKLAEGDKALQARLEKEPRDDQARFGLGVVQFFRALERLGCSLHRHGLRTEDGLALVGGPLGLYQGPEQVRKWLPQKPRSEKLTYKGYRQILQEWVDDLNRAEKTLGGVKALDVKLPLHVGRIQLDLFGSGKPGSAAEFLGQFGEGVEKERKAAEDLVIGFDRGDVCWLRGYCHFLAAWGELQLAVDGQELFDHTAHLFFENVDSPHPFLQEERRKSKDLKDVVRAGTVADAIAFIHLLRLPVKEPERCKAALAHLEAMVGQAKEMWPFILAETDDDNEWIPNPMQKGVLGVKVTQERVDTWLATLDEVELILQGKRLVPFWRGKPDGRGLNLRKVFTEPRTFDPILWFQGTAATPYLEKGELTKLAEPRMRQRINDAFGGVNFIGFAFWFN